MQLLGLLLRFSVLFSGCHPFLRPSYYLYIYIYIYIHNLQGIRNCAWKPGRGLTNCSSSSLMRWSNEGRYRPLFQYEDTVLASTLLRCSCLPDVLGIHGWILLHVYGLMKRYWKNKHTRQCNSKFKNQSYFMITLTNAIRE